MLICVNVVKTIKNNRFKFCRVTKYGGGGLKFTSLKFPLTVLNGKSRNHKNCASIN